MGINGAKLALLIPRLSSEFDGEIIATVHAIRRLLKADGHDLHDLARVVAGKTAPTTTTRKSKETDEGRKPDGIVVVAEHFLNTCSWLSGWERQFLESIRDQARSKYGFKLSEKQRAILDELVRKEMDITRGRHG
jgi:hypothetical protein